MEKNNTKKQLRTEGFCKLVNRTKSQTEFARITGMDQSYVSKLCSGRRVPYQSTLDRCTKLVDNYYPIEEESAMVHEDEPEYNKLEQHRDPLVALTMEKLHEAADYVKSHPFSSSKEIDGHLLVIAMQLLSKYRDYFR